MHERHWRKVPADPEYCIQTLYWPEHKWNRLVVFRSERSFRLQVLIFAVTIIAGFIFRITGTEWVFILVAGGVVLVCEMINTAIEYVTDLVTEEYRILAKHIKNISAGAVLVSSIIAVIIGLIIFIPYFLEYF